MMSSLLSAVDALRASSGKKRGWPSTEKGASILGKVSYFLLFEMTISFGLNSFRRKNFTDWSPRTACRAKCDFEFSDDSDWEHASMHTPAGVFEGDIKSTEEQRTNNMLFAGNPGEGSSQSNGLMESSLTSLTVVQVSTRSFFQT